MDVKRICPNCFKLKYSHGECEDCHYSEKYRQLVPEALEPYTILNGRYLIGTTIGKGGFGITYKCLDLISGYKSAIKEYFPRYIVEHRRNLAYLDDESREAFEEGRKRFKEEARLLMKMNQNQLQYVIAAYDTFDENHTSYYVMNYVLGTTLKEVSQSYHFSLEEITTVILKVATELNIIHKEYHILHRDISPENILIKNDFNPVLIDFGSAKYMENNQLYTVVIKRHYAPIEQYYSTGEQGPYTDVYALAATYYYLLTGEYIPEAPDRLFNNAAYKPLTAYPIGISKELSDIVDLALKVEPKDRLQNLDLFIKALSFEISAATIQSQVHKKIKASFIRLMDGKMGTRKYPIKHQQSLTVGRREYNDIQIPYREISRDAHLGITYDEMNHCFIVKEKSTNGSIIGEQYCFHQTVTVKENTVIKFINIDTLLILEVDYE